MRENIGGALPLAITPNEKYNGDDDDDDGYVSSFWSSFLGI